MQAAFKQPDLGQRKLDFFFHREAFFAAIFRRSLTTRLFVKGEIGHFSIPC
jgi:hypothetical protein